MKTTIASIAVSTGEELIKALQSLPDDPSVTYLEGGDHTLHLIEEKLSDGSIVENIRLAPR